MEEFLKENTIEDLQKDLSITVTNKGLELFKKVMNQKWTLEAEQNYK